MWSGFNKLWEDKSANKKTKNQVQDNLLLDILVPLLALPQITHYVLNGFIWKVSRDKTLEH